MLPETDQSHGQRPRWLGPLQGNSLVVKRCHLVSDFLPTAPYRGTRDFLPAEMSVRTHVFHRLYDVIERYGYQRYDRPILEPVEIYEPKSSRETLGDGAAEIAVCEAGAPLSEAPGSFSAIMVHTS